MVPYFPAVSPPRNPSGPSRKHAEECLFLSIIELPLQSIQHFGFVDQEFHRCNCPTQGFDSDTGNHISQLVISFCLFDASSTS
jgi:hypothetical protein